MSNESLLTFGASSSPPAPLLLRAGPLHMFFEPENVFLRRICLNEHEVWRGVYAAVRDQNWGTVLPRIEKLHANVRDDSFELAFEVDCRCGEIHFRWRGEIIGEPSGSLMFRFNGEALATFLRNRIGFCLLHPRACAGARARFANVAGDLVETRFSDRIEPQIVGQATFRDLRSLAHEVAPGLWAQCEFEGDLFETEDQRNWTDASFKTYCTPLARPFPVQVSAGTRVEQVVRLSLLPNPAKVAGALFATAESTKNISCSASRAGTLDLNFEQCPVIAMPQLGVGIASHGEQLSPLEVRRFAALRLGHLRADLHLSEQTWQNSLAAMLTQTRQIGCKLELAVHLPGSDALAREQLCRLQPLLAEQPELLTRILVFKDREPATGTDSLALVRQFCAPLNVPIGGGTDANFCELNREQSLGRFGLSQADIVAWPITPQVHAFDNRSIMETLEAQADTLATARTFAGNRPLLISPITLKPRFNAVANAPAQDAPGAGTARPRVRSQPYPASLPPEVDARQASFFAAAWTLGSIVTLASARASSLTLYETTGWRGLMETAKGSPLPALFPFEPGAVFPVYFVFAALAGFTRCAAQFLPGRIAALKLLAPGDAQRVRVLIADLSGEGAEVRLRWESPGPRLHLLDPLTVKQALHDPENVTMATASELPSLPGLVTVRLQPHALAWLD